MRADFRPLLILVAILLMVASGCSEGDNTLGGIKGQVQFVIASADDGSTAALTSDDDRDHGGGGEDHRRLAEANVTFTSILARNIEGEMIDVEIDLPVTVDVLGMSRGRQFELPVGSLPPGFYDEVWVVMKQVEVVLLDGTRIAITPPGGGWTSIVSVCPFEIADGATTTVQFRFKPKKSFKFDGKHWKFNHDLALECDGGDEVVQPR